MERLAVLLLLVMASLSRGQEEELQRNFTQLSLNFFDPGNKAGSIVFSPLVIGADTAFVLRYVVVLAGNNWGHTAACDPNGKALNFWGERHQLSEEVCSDPATLPVMFAYGVMRALENELPEVTGPYAQLMKDVGFDPFDPSRDRTTAVGYASSEGVRWAEWLSKDGWNSRGDLSRTDFPQRFEDYTGYTPVNSPWSLKYPLRWQPLVQADPRPGRFNTQTHVFPFLGQVRPLLLTREELESRQVDPPYENMDATELSGKDAETMDFLVKELFNVSANLTPEQRFFSGFWDNKALSGGFFAPVHSLALGLTPFELNRFGLGDALGQYDAAILAWKEKRRVDAVRPVSIMRNFYKDTEFTAYVSEQEIRKTIKAGDWEPLIPIQPHSEFPSASAAICTAFADFGDLFMKEFVPAKGLDKEPPFIFPIPPGLTPINPEGFTVVKFDSYLEAGESCRQSRLWAGVHFQPSVPAGEQLAEGLGQRAFDFVKKLLEGEVPETCWWCTSA